MVRVDILLPKLPGRVISASRGGLYSMPRLGGDLVSAVREPRPEAAEEAKGVVCCSEGHKDSDWIGVLLHRLLPGVRKGSLLFVVQDSPSRRLRHKREQ
jgi:hypothetical protein